MTDDRWVVALDIEETDGPVRDVHGLVEPQDDPIGYRGDRLA